MYKDEIKAVRWELVAINEFDSYHTLPEGIRIAPRNWLTNAPLDWNMCVAHAKFIRAIYQIYQHDAE
jgi:hypothetical protein